MKRHIKTGRCLFNQVITALWTILLKLDSNMVMNSSPMISLEINRSLNYGRRPAHQPATQENMRPSNQLRITYKEDKLTSYCLEIYHYVKN